MTDYMDTTTDTNVIPTIVAAETLGALRSNIVLASIVNRDFENEIASYGDTVDIGIRAALTVNDKGVGADVTVQDPTTTKASLVLNKHKEVTFGQEDTARMFARPDLISGYARDAAIAIAEQIEADIAALYSGFSQTIDASTGLNEDDFREANRLMNAAKVPLSDRWAVLHEDAYSEAENIEQFINRDYQGDAALAAVKNGFLGFLKGFNTVLSQNIVVSTTCKNLFMQRNAVAMASRPMIRTDLATVEQATMSENGVGLRVTRWYNANALAEQLTIDVLYGVVELRDNHAVVVSTAEV